MSRTRLGDLAGLLVGAGLLIYALLLFLYDDLPPLGPVAPLPLAALAFAEFVLARRVRRVIGRDPDVKPLAAIAIARLVALGKASALVGAGVAGAALAVAAHVLPDVGRVDVARTDAIVAGLVTVAALMLAAAGIALERSGIAPTGRSGA